MGAGSSDGGRRGGDGASELLDAWLEGLRAVAAAQRRAAETLSEESDFAEADALWAAAESQFALWRRGARSAAAGARSAPGVETLARFLDPGFWLRGDAVAVDPELARLIDGPSPAELSEFGRSALVETPEWRALRRAAAAYRRVVAPAWERCFRRIADETANASLDPVEALRRWVGAVEAEHAALRRSETFIAAQSALLDAATALREREAAMVEAWCEARALPTRREVDDLHRSMADLRRELRALKRELGRA